MKIKDLLNESYDPNSIYLHGGPPELEGGHFKRFMKSGKDSGALFFIKESYTGYKYALGYAILKFRNGGVWRVKINLSEDKVFDFSKKEHRQIAKENLNQEEYEHWLNSSKNGYLDWNVINEDILRKWGFEGAVLFERPQGFGGFDEDAISIAVFDPKHVEIIDFISKKELLKKYK